MFRRKAFTLVELLGVIAGDINCDGVVDFKDLAILCNNWLAGVEPE